ncbi:MAG: ATP synthase subunit F [Ruminococcus sp.]|nr:ATP synthase subunit F [Ruminococcus sp.]
MQFYLISDNSDTAMGMRLTGVPGVVVHDEAGVRHALESAMENPDVAIILMTEKLVELCAELVYDIKLNRRAPLIVEIPDRHATTHISDAIDRYIADAIGIRMS